MRQGLYFHAGLLVVAIGLAYAIWTGDEPDKREKPTVVELDADAVTGLRYVWPEGETAITPKGKGEARAYEVALTRRIKKLQPKPKAASQPASQPELAEAASPPAAHVPAPEPEPEVVEEKSSFPAGDAVVRAIEQLAPLKAVRALGQVEAARLEKMGLKTPERRLAVQAGGKSYTVEIGDSTYGAQGRYARLEGGDEVFLVPSTLTTGFEGTERRLMEQRLVTVDLEKIEGVDVRYGVQKASFVHVDREQASKRHFALSSSPDLRSEEATGMVSRLRGLRANAYMQSPPPPGTVTEAAHFVVRAEGGEPSRVTLLEQADGSGYLAQAGAWYARLADAPARALLEDLASAIPSE